MDPVSVEPEPQKSSAGNTVASSPAKVAFRLLVKVISVAAFIRSKLLIVKVNGTELPGVDDVGNIACAKLLVTLSSAITSEEPSTASLK